MERVTEGRGGAPSLERPFFLVGSERSGSTMLRLMLDHHPQIACAGESEFLVERIKHPKTWPKPATYREWLETDRVFLHHRLQLDPSLSYPDLMRDFLRQRAERAGKPLVGATVHRHFDRLLRIWPEARFVHLLRDGRDVAPSCVRMGWAGNPWQGARRWIEAERLWDRVEAQLGPERHVELRYEKLLEDPKGELTRLCRFLGTDYDPQMLEYDRDSTYSRPDPALAQRWRSQLSERDLRMLEHRIGALLQRRGYALSGQPPLPVTGLRWFGLQIQDRWARMRFAQERYGLRLWLSRVLATRLPFRGWRRRVQLALNAVDDQHLA